MAARAPLSPDLQPYVGSLWIGTSARSGRECMIPCGEMHLAIRIDGPPVRLFAGASDRHGDGIAEAVVCGARSRSYFKQAAPACTIGAQLRPGAARALFGVSAASLAERHLPLRTLWGVAADRLHRNLAAAPTPEDRLAVLERALLAQLRPARDLHPQVEQALLRFDRGTDVGAALAELDCSHRHFIALFRDAAGLAPKRYARLRRFHRLLTRLPPQGADWSSLALDHGYCDQPHLIRDFHEFAGLPPRAYQRRRLHVRHVSAD